MHREATISADFVQRLCFGILATALLAMTLAWHIPMMLWDHLDLVPIYQAWQHGTLADSGFLRIHGGHLHTAAYAVLLATTELSGGRPWLDCLVSWLLLMAFAGTVMTFARETFAVRAPGGVACSLLVVLLALYPGHVANLQWGWQVAVFLCLLGISTTIYTLTRPTLSWSHQVVALLAAALAYFSFATGIACIPTAIALTMLRHDTPLRMRLAMTLPWLVAGLSIGVGYPRPAPSDPSPDTATTAIYALNFLGAGIARITPTLALWLACMALASGAWMYARCRHARDALPWLGLLLFATISSVLVALGRAAPFGSEHAFVTRYVSFSSLFWLGWAGLFGCMLRYRSPGRILRIGACLVALLASVNGLHMIRKAAHVGARTRETAATIRATYPQVDRRLLAEIYFDQPQVAQERLDALYMLGFAPFDRTGNAGSR